MKFLNPDYIKYKSSFKFINRYEDLIDENKFYDLYYHAAAEAQHLPDITRILYGAGIDPLLHMKKIPHDFIASDHGVIEITIPDNITTLEDSCFYDCIRLEELIIPKNVSIIEDWSLSGLDNLEELTIEGQLSGLGKLAIYENFNLKKIYSPAVNRSILFNCVSELMNGTCKFIEI